MNKRNSQYWVNRLADPRLLDIEEMAEIFDRAVGTIRRQLGKGTFPIEPRIRAKRTPTKWSPLDVQAWLANPKAKHGGAR